MSKVEALGAAAVEAAHRAARAAVEAVFDAITAAAEAAANYVSALYRAVASAAAEAYAEVKRVVAQACDAVKRAASCVSSRVVELIECLHGVTAAAWAKTKLDGVNGFVRAGDVASLVAAILDGIKRASTQFVPPESSKSRRASSATADIMELLRLIDPVAHVCMAYIATFKNDMSNQSCFVSVALDPAGCICFL